MSSQILSPKTSRTFTDAVQLTRVAPETDGGLREQVDDSFIAIPQYVPWPKAYGGDMVAQATAAMIATVDNGRVLHSIHSTFMRPVNMLEPVKYDVERIRDGRNYSTRHVRAVQNGKTTFLATGSFQVPQGGGDYQRDPVHELSIDPASLASAEEALAEVTSPAAEYWAAGRSFDMRHIPGPVYLDAPDSPQGSRGTVTQAIWLKSFSPLPQGADNHETANLHRVGLSYVCDYTILEPLLRAQGLSWSTEGLVTASLDHAMWFHRSVNVDDWILYAQEAESIQSSRGLALGRFFDRSGRLLATVAQEGMISHDSATESTPEPS